MPIFGKKIPTTGEIINEADKALRVEPINVSNKKNGDYNKEGTLGEELLPGSPEISNMPEKSIMRVKVFRKDFFNTIDNSYMNVDLYKYNNVTFYILFFENNFIVRPNITLPWDNMKTVNISNNQFIDINGKKITIYKLNLQTVLGSIGSMLSIGSLTTPATGGKKRRTKKSKRSKKSKKARKTARK